MNVDRNIKLLLLKINRLGRNVTLIKEQRYSEMFDNIYARYKLTFWHKEFKKNRKGEVKEVNIPDTYEFSNGIELLKFLVVKSNERKAEEIR